MSILPLLLSLLAVNTVSCSEAPSRAQLLEMVQKLTGRVEKVEEKGNLTDEVGKLGEAMTGAMEKLGDKLTQGLEKLGETQRANQTIWPSSCVGVRENDKTSQVHTLKVNDRYIQVYCDQDTAGGGWTVIQRRQDGSVDFYRNWTEYRQGFGDIKGNFWLGLDTIRLLTTSQQQTLRVDLKDFDNNTAYAEYRFFAIDGPDSFYRLHVDGYTGTAGDSLTYSNNRPFSTHDSDHDSHSRVNCAVGRHGAWWYGWCAHSNLNGPYLTSAPGTLQNIYWYHLKGAYIALKHVEMKIRPAM